MLPLVGYVREGDGHDPRFDAKDKLARETHRKQMALCQQAARAVQYTLSAEIQDNELQALELVQVVPAPNTTRLLVQLKMPKDMEADPVELAEKLNNLRSLFRSEVAEQINRRKTPELAFTVVPELSSP